MQVQVLTLAPMLVQGDECKAVERLGSQLSPSEFESRHRRHRDRGREAQALDCRSRLREFESRRSRCLNAGVAERNEALLF